METKYLRVTPQCCEQSTKHRVPYLEFPWEESERRRGYLKDRKPVWCVKGIDSFSRTHGLPTHYYESSMEVNFCPYCGTPVPEIELNPLAKDDEIYNTDSGDYCESCGERSMCCDCIPAPFRWKPVGKELVTPNKEERDDDDYE